MARNDGLNRPQSRCKNSGRNFRGQRLEEEDDARPVLSVALDGLGSGPREKWKKEKNKKRRWARIGLRMLGKTTRCGASLTGDASGLLVFVRARKSKAKVIGSVNTREKKRNKGHRSIGLARAGQGEKD